MRKRRNTWWIIFQLIQKTLKYKFALCERKLFFEIMPNSKISIEPQKFYMTYAKKFRINPKFFMHFWHHTISPLGASSHDLLVSVKNIFKNSEKRIGHLTTKISICLTFKNAFTNVKRIFFDNCSGIPDKLTGNILDTLISWK